MKFFKLFVFLIFGVLLPVSVNAEECEIEDWIVKFDNMLKVLEIQGVATCNSGLFKLRLYEGEGENRKFYGVEDAFIEGYTFGYSV